MAINYIRRLSAKILLAVLIIVVCFSHFLFLSQLDFVIYDHDNFHGAAPAVKGYYQLKDKDIGNFLKDMFNPHQYHYPRYPAFIPYLIALICYFFGLNEIIMRCVPLIFYLILIFYTYKCAKELDSKKTGILSILILVTMPVMVFWSRMIFPTFFGISIFMVTFYYALKSRGCSDLPNYILFGLFTGLCLLTHRVMFMPIVVLWIIAIAYSLQKGKILKSLKGFSSALIITLIVAGNFLVTYFKGYDAYRDLHQYSFFNNTEYFWLFGIGNVFWRLKESIIQFGYDNLVVIFLLIISVIFGKHKKIAKDKIILFQYFTIVLFCLFLGIWFTVTYFSKIRIVNVRHFQIFGPMIAIIIAFYLNRARFLTRNVVILIKGILISSLLLMMIPRFGNSAILSPFRSYYRIPNANGNGVIWNNRTFARKNELEYFKTEISKGAIAVMNEIAFNPLVSLRDRLLFNGVGRSYPYELVDLKAVYIAFYCRSYNSLKKVSPDYYPQILTNYSRDSDRHESLLKIQRFIDENMVGELGRNEKVAIVNTEKEFQHADFILDFITYFNFKKVKSFEYHVGNTKMYRIIFKCTENLSELKNLDKWRKQLCFLRKFY